VVEMFVLIEVVGEVGEVGEVGNGWKWMVAPKRLLEQIAVTMLQIIN